MTQLEIEKKADEYVGMFIVEIIEQTPYYFVENNAIKCAIKLVDELISQAKNIKTLVDEEHANIEIEIEVIRNLLKIKECLTNRLK